MTLPIRLVALVVVLACTPLDEREMAEREYAREAYRARFLEFARRCEQAGGQVVIRSRGRIGHERIPNPGDRYNCAMD